MADATKYCVVRTDLMSGTQDLADLLSVRFYGEDDQPAEVENGVIAKIEALEDGEREVYKVKAAKSGDDLNECCILCAPEILYDERKVNLDEYINEKNKIVRAYIPRSRNVMSWTAEGFVDGTVPAVGDTIGIGTDGKLDKSGTGFGKCIAVEPAGRVTYYAVEIGKTELAGA